MGDAKGLARRRGQGFVRCQQRQRLVKRRGGFVGTVARQQGLAKRPQNVCPGRIGFGQGGDVGLQHLDAQGGEVRFFFQCRQNARKGFRVEGGTERLDRRSRLGSNGSIGLHLRIGAGQNRIKIRPSAQGGDRFNRGESHAAIRIRHQRRQRSDRFGNT